MGKFFCILVILNLKCFFVNGRSIERVDIVNDLWNKHADNPIVLLNLLTSKEQSPIKSRVARDAPPSWMIQPPNQQSVPSWLQRTQAPINNQPIPQQNLNNQPQNIIQQPQQPNPSPIIQTTRRPWQNQQQNINQQPQQPNPAPIIQTTRRPWQNQQQNNNQQPQQPNPAPIVQSTQRPWQNQPQWEQNQPQWNQNQPQWNQNQPQWDQNQPQWNQNQPQWNQNQQPQVTQWSPEIIATTQNSWIQTEKPPATYPPVFLPDQINPITNQPVTEQIILKTPPAWIPQPEKPSIVDEEVSQEPQTQTTRSIITAPVIRSTAASIQSSDAPDINVNPWNRLPIVQPINPLVTHHPLFTAPVIRRSSVNQAVQGPEIVPIQPIQGIMTPRITAPTRVTTELPSINRQTEIPQWVNTQFTAPVITKGTTRQNPMIPVTAPRVTTTRPTIRPEVVTTRPTVTTRQPMTTTRLSITTARPTPVIPIFNPGAPQTTTSRPPFPTVPTNPTALTVPTRPTIPTPTTRPITNTPRQPLTATASPLTTRRPIITRTTSTQRPIVIRTTTTQRQTTTTAKPTRDISRTTQAIKEQQPQRNQQSLNDIMKMTENIFSTLNNHILQSLGQLGRK